jgi:hypothetical protein
LACACSSAALSAAPFSSSDCAALATCRRALCGALRRADAPAGRAAVAQGRGATVAASIVGESIGCPLSGLGTECRLWGASNRGTVAQLGPSGPAI